MAKKKRKNKRDIWITIGAVALAITVVGCLIKFLVIDKVEDKAAEEVVSTLLNSETADDTEIANGMTADELYDSMDAEDQEALKEVVTDHLDAKTVSEASKYVSDGDTEGLKEYAKETLSDEDLDTVKELYKKYTQQ